MQYDFEILEQKCCAKRHSTNFSNVCLAYNLE